MVRQVPAVHAALLYGGRGQDHELLPKNIEGTRAKLKRLVKLRVLAVVDANSFAGMQYSAKPG
jgi:hypothetical protein